MGTFSEEIKKRPLTIQYAQHPLVLALTLSQAEVKGRKLFFTVLRENNHSEIIEVSVRWFNLEQSKGSVNATLEIEGIISEEGQKVYVKIKIPLYPMKVSGNIEMTDYL